MSNKNNCALLLCVLALLILITLNNINYADTTNSRPLVIANIESNKPIYFDVSADESGDIHLIWLTRDNILTYQKSTDEGKNWISIHTVKIPIIQERIQPSIFAIKSQVFIIWAFDGCLYRLASPDNGNTWDTIQTVIDKPARRITFPGGRSYVDNYDSISVANTPTLVISGQILDSTIYIAYESLNWLGTFISKSYDLGIHWTQPILLFPNDFCEERTPSLTMFVDLNGVHLFYRNLHPTDSINYGMNYMFSPDKGSTWRNRGRICTLTKDPEDVCVIDSTGELPILIAGKDTLQFMYRVEDLYRLISDNNGQTWSGPYSFGIGYIEEFTVYSDKNGKLVIPFISIINQKTVVPDTLPEWLIYVLTGDNGNEWDNNDLYILSMTNDDININRITERLTYVQTFNLTFIHSMKCVEVKDKIFVFWAGKEMESRYALDPTNSKFQIFFAIVQ